VDTGFGGYPAIRFEASTTNMMSSKFRQGIILMGKKIHLALITPEMSREEARKNLLAALRRSGLEIKPSTGVKK